MLFMKTLNGWDSWCKVFDSVEAFSPLAHAIFLKEGLSIKSPLQKLTPGTNAVFRADDWVIKLFAPMEASIDTKDDYHTELSVMKFAMDHGISVPKLIGYGETRDRYLFRYLIMEYIPAVQSIDELLASPASVKMEFAERIKEILTKLNRPGPDPLPLLDLSDQSTRLKRMEGLNPALIHGLSLVAEEQDLSKPVVVHGDITRDNLIIGSDGSVTLIDFADSRLAPACYELPALVFELFLCDKELVSAYIGKEDRERFLDALIGGLSLHLFCGNILKDYFEQIDWPKDRIASVPELKQLLQDQFFSE
ncbi:phosphotransferase family protein [Gorillibacterium timonense]|uniref:phosphotransferase family protein n=1 Tax=Gorillibacterium timonense TaxID=1689269 RepID=UPI00071E4056|nr:aminoglycoside phosphotransferase family protein [Gorillibacterium timonense]